MTLEWHQGTLVTLLFSTFPKKCFLAYFSWTGPNGYISPSETAATAEYELVDLKNGWDISIIYYKTIYASPEIILTLSTCRPSKCPKLYTTMISSENNLR